MKFPVVVLCFGAFLPCFYLEGKAFNYHGFGHVQHGGRNSENTFVDRLRRHRTRRNADGNATNCKTNSNCTDKINHKYYVSQTFITGQRFWRNIEGNPNKTVHADLLQSFSAKKTLKLSFKFPYYGHYLDSVVLTARGFLYMDVYNTSLMTDVQYLAPLMAYFSPDHHPDSQVIALDDGSELTVQWSKVYLRNRTHDGHFTFQCTLHKNGTIWFAYKEIPVNVSSIPDVPYHPVKVGISDAFVISHRLPRRYIFRTFYIYSQVKISKNIVVNGSAVEFHPQTSCVSANSCTECMQRKQTTIYDCQWCPQTQRCSDGLDRHREEWELHRCSANAVKQNKTCFSQVNITKNSTGYCCPWMSSRISCVSVNSCTECMQQKQTTTFDCQWCPQTQRCSDGLNRHSEEWDLHRCSENAVKQLKTCFSQVNITKNSTSCVSANSCTECMQRKQTTTFDCQWCPQTQRCSDGTDRHRTEWDLHRCSANAVKQLSDKRCVVGTEKQQGKSSGGIGTGSIVGICIFLALLIGFAAWCVYAYRNPATRSGLFFIDAVRRLRELFKRSGDRSGSTDVVPSSKA